MGNLKKTLIAATINIVGGTIASAFLGGFYAAGATFGMLMLAWGLILYIVNE